MGWLWHSPPSRAGRRPVDSTYASDGPLFHGLRNRAYGTNVVAGVTRLMALEFLGWDRIPCVVLPDSMDDRSLCAISIAENTARTAMSLGDTVRGLLKVFASGVSDLGEAAVILGQPLDNAKIAAQLTQLVPDGLAKMEKGKIGTEFALELSKLSKPKQSAILRRLRDFTSYNDEGPDVRMLRRDIAKERVNAADVDFTEERFLEAGGTVNRNLLGEVSYEPYSLVMDIQRQRGQEMAEKLRTADFDLEDFLSQLQQVKKMGSMQSIMGMIPGMSGLKQLNEQRANMDPKQLDRVEAIINSMTPGERRNHAVINGSRRKRIARGSGTTVEEINRLLKQFTEMQRAIAGPALARDVRRITDVCETPLLVDADTGFGASAFNIARTVKSLTKFGAAGMHIEDQVGAKRCGHRPNKEVVSPQEMVDRIRAAVDARTDDQFVIMARTDARAVEGLDGAIARAKAYVDAGADAIFPEALADESEFEKFRKAIKVPLLANMTEFGKSKLLTTKQLSDLGFNIVIYPVTTLRLAMKAIEDSLATIKSEGTQESLLKQMQTRAELYELIRYKDYKQFDKDVFNFKF